MRIKPKDIKPLREKLLVEQNYICPLCMDIINPKDAVLDHCHREGNIRSVLHRGCNAFIGHIENNQKRNLIDSHRLANILSHFENYVKTLKPILHPTYRTPEEKKERARKRAKARRKRTKNLD